VAGVPTSRTGLAAGVAAYVLWGLFPLYWPLLEPAGSAEILAHRVVWSFVFLVIVLALFLPFRRSRRNRHSSRTKVAAK
jgi:chloramphenicol-sensitive protein RarD